MSDFNGTTSLVRLSTNIKDIGLLVAERAKKLSGRYLTWRRRNIYMNNILYEQKYIYLSSRQWFSLSYTIYNSLSTTATRSKPAHRRREPNSDAIVLQSNARKWIVMKRAQPIGTKCREFTGNSRVQIPKVNELACHTNFNIFTE